LIVTRGPGDNKLVYGPTTRIEGKERCAREETKKNYLHQKG
jgi:hypothetical protein